MARLARDVANGFSLYRNERDANGHFAVPPVNKDAAAALEKGRARLMSKEKR